MYGVFPSRLSEIPFLKVTDYSILFDPNRLKLSFIPNFILNDPTTKLYDGVKVYSLGEGVACFDDGIYYDTYRWTIQNFDSYHKFNDLVYSVDDLDTVTQKFLRLNRCKIEIQTGFGEKRYIWRGQQYFHITQKRTWDVVEYRDLMPDFRFTDPSSVNVLINDLFHIKDPVCFDYVAHHIRDNLGLSLTRDLCAPDAIAIFLEKQAITPRTSYAKMNKVVKDQIYSWFNILVRSKIAYENMDMFKLLVCAALFLKVDQNNWGSIQKILKYGKISHEVLKHHNGTSCVQIFDWKDEPLIHFYLDDINCYFCKSKGETKGYHGLYSAMWNLVRTRPKETSELFLGAGACLPQECA